MEDPSSSCLLISLPFRAPECFNDKLGGVSTKCDIFSFGVILWELVTQTRPWAGLNEFQMIYQVTINNARLDIPKDPKCCPPALQRLIESCWHNRPEDRPCAEEMLGQMEAVVQALEDGALGAGLQAGD